MFSKFDIIRQMNQERISEKHLSRHKYLGKQFRHTYINQKKFKKNKIVKSNHITLIIFL
jgi:hypothetical protein